MMKDWVPPSVNAIDLPPQFGGGNANSGHEQTGKIDKR
jgi:hypothetical protein